MPEWLIPVLTFLSGIAGGYVGARVPVVRLETQMLDLLQWKSQASDKISRYNEDLFTHDVELQQVMVKLDLPRVSRQRLRDRDE
jgi:hypothetical protein